MAKQTPEKPVIGILGGVGAGKSTVARELVALGCVLVDGDQIGHRLMADEEVKQELRARWGQRIFLPDGSVDRKALSAIVFDSPEQLAALNGITQWRIGRQIENEIALGRKNPATSAIVLDAAIMLEAGWDEFCTHLVFVEAPSRLRHERVESSRNWDQGAWEAREKSQISLDTKRKGCYLTLVNSSSVSSLNKQVRELFDRIVHKTEHPKR